MTSSAHAWAVLACPPTDDRAELRRVYLRRLRVTHPDVNPSDDATKATAELTRAYEHLDDVLAGGPGTWPEPPTSPPPSSTPTATSSDQRTADHADRDRGQQPTSPGQRPAWGWEWTSPPPLVLPDAWVLTNDTVAIAAPPDEAFDALIDALCEIGDVTYLDPHAAIIQTVVTFVDEPVCWMVTTLQGRAATGVTEVHCAIESIEERPPPPIGAVTELLASTFETP